MPVAERESELGIGLVVLGRLQADEGEAQQEGQGQKNLQAGAVPGDQRMVCNG